MTPPERPKPPARSSDLVYTEADVAEMRTRWEWATKEQNFNTALAQLSGQVAALPAQFEQIARKVFTQMESETAQQKETDRDHLFGRAQQFSNILQAITALCVLYLAAKGAHVIP